MNKFELYYKDLSKDKKTIKGYYLYIDQINKLLIIDNIIIEKLANLSQIKFLTKGYYQVINL